MAHLNEQTDEIVFNQNDLINAWGNAPKISDANPDEFRVCMYCQFPMNKKHYVANHHLKYRGDAWMIDLVNLKKPKLVGKNYLAIHAGCFGLRQKENQTRRLKRYNRTKWLMPKNE